MFLKGLKFLGNNPDSRFLASHGYEGVLGNLLDPPRLADNDWTPKSTNPRLCSQYHMNLSRAQAETLNLKNNQREQW